MVVVDLVQWWSREEREELKSRRSYIQPGRSQKSQICDFHSKATYGGDGRRGIQKFTGFGSTSEDQNAISMADPVISSLKKMKILVGLRVSWGGGASKSKGVFRLNFVQTIWKLMQK
ncbi:hypothetical protein L2E82_05680 [Cichorium intybus]|uniref:Uncharacterized protein n=1 Tax=Cichorium intybus TaxID=13427 RepID=A0ACB9HA45_CICIN|nr:hypothetical protein L2E82_05680 [Cichorium intybus]